MFEGFITSPSINYVETNAYVVRENKNIFIYFNVNLLNCVNHVASENFLSMMNFNSLLPYIRQPTRVTDIRSATLIDNIFANIFNFNTISGNLITKLSDHLPQFLIIEDLKILSKLCRPQLFQL